MEQSIGNIDILISKLEYLQLPDFYISREFEDNIEPYIDKNVLGAGGAASSVHLVKSPNLPPLVVKITHPCSSQYTLETLQRYCQDMSNPNSIRHNPYGDKKLIELPNFLMEAIIGGYLKRLDDTQLCPHFSYSLGVWINPQKKESYNLQPLYKTDLTSILTSIEAIYLFLFQFAFAVGVGQEVFRFTNYDTHTGNVFYQRTKNNYSYPVLNKNGQVERYAVNGAGWAVKIADFGLSRMETSDIVINATVDDYPIRTSGQFNHWYDMAGLVGSLLIGKTKLAEQVRNILHNDDVSNIFSIVFGIDKSTIENEKDEFLSFYYAYSPKRANPWRPVGMPKIEYRDMPSIHDVIRKFLRELVKRDIARKINEGDKIGNKKYTKILALPTYSLFTPEFFRGANEPNENPDQGERLGVPSSAISPEYEVVKIAPGIVYHGHRLIYQRGPQPWQWTLSDLDKELCTYKVQYVHIMYINTDLAKRNGYELKLECCKLDVLSYMSKHFGVAVNGNFFDIGAKGTKKPIGPYKQERSNKKSPDFITDLPIPEQYQKFYGKLQINNGKVGISYDPTAKQIGVDKKSEYLYSGPLLVYNGDIAFTPKLFEWTENIDGKKVKIFQCREGGVDATGKAVKYVPPGLVSQTTALGVNCIPVNRYIDDYIPNCKAITPGELSHAGNPNPRTMILTRNPVDGLGDLAIVYVEGRDDRGMGMDLADLASLAKKLGAINALNLDGGRSSAMAWRLESAPDYVKTANVKHKDFYPVGNLITLVKRK